MLRIISFLGGVILLLGNLAGCAKSQYIIVREHKDTGELEYYQSEPGQFEAEKVNGEWQKVKHDSKSAPLLNLGGLPKMEFD